ncbi:adenylate/guanylate cyclase domain-containing protein [Candidatus Magnetominusculus dajiuhuensis]|uniref:adenylate/guanylate cyclase domain-containing protein n=1 Tax=Candidatus Magnetominusculus dajiuhuensis TaxID=3137712 RepID=UPI003B431933
MIDSAKTQIYENLSVGGRVFSELMSRRAVQLAQMTRLLSTDFAFKNAVATSDHETIISVLENLKTRVNAHMVMLISLDRIVLANTMHQEIEKDTLQVPEALTEAENRGEASAIVTMDGKTYQIIIVPLLAPDPIAWVCTGFVIDDNLLFELKKLILAHISIINTNRTESRPVIASTLPKQASDALLKAISKVDIEKEKTMEVNYGGEKYVTTITTLQNTHGYSIIAALQRSLNDVLKPFYRLRRVLYVFFVLTLLCSILASLRIARSVTRPVSILVEGVREIAKGIYSHRVEIRYRDEIGELAEAFNMMSIGLEEKELVAELLGKVVSPAIAHELLKKNVELGGEEREVTILFSDIRNFTTISENHPPKQVLTVLNMYMTSMSAIIEKYGGVIDKYIGDAIMALYGAPIANPDDADRALNSAIEMMEALNSVNTEIEHMGFAPIDIGIGINTDIVLAGNMGSKSRLNYTVIGDGVNIASRLETLTKSEEFKTKIIVSSTTLSKSRGDYLTRSLGSVAVKGKSEKITIYALNGLAPEEHQRSDEDTH